MTFTAGKPKGKALEPLFTMTGQQTVGEATRDNFLVEEYFSQWRRNLMEPNVQPMKKIKLRKQQPPMAENVFSDWLGNLKEPTSFRMRKDTNKRAKPLKAGTKRRSVIDDLESLIDQEDLALEMATVKPNRKKSKGKAKK